MSGEELRAPRALPTREAQVKQAFVAITRVFFLGVAIGFALAKAF